MTNANVAEDGSMIFHKKVAGGLSLDRDTEESFALSYPRIFLAVGLLVLLFGAAFAFWSAGWQAGSDRLLHFSEIIFGAFVGLLFGERLAISQKS
jgi:hypothetical protein